MDPKPQMPDIKAEVNKVDDGKKKATGLLGGLFGSGGSGAAGGLGGIGGLGAGASGAAGFGGLLATKAGILALVMMGSAVAGGIGLAGYKMFGPGESDKTGGNLSLFAPRTQPAVDPNAVAPVNADGSSASLNFMSAAAAKDKAAEDAANAAASAAAPTDNTAGDAAKAAAAADAASRASQARAASGGAINSGGGAGATGSMGQGLANVKKLGALSSGTSGGATTSASSGAAGRLGDNLSNASKNGASSAFSRQGGAAKTSSASRAVGGRSTSARTALRNVGIDQKGGRAGSSFAAGRTYDGTTAGGSGGIGPDGGAIGMGGVGDGAGAQPKTLGANSANQVNKQEPPPAEPPAKDVTPWAKEIMMGMAAGAIAVALLMWASSMMKEAKAAALLALGTTPVGTVAYAAAVSQLQIAKLIIGAAIAAALVGVMFGGMISGGKNGQTLQGGLLIASSLAIAAAGMWLFTSADIPAIGDAQGLKGDAQVAAFGAPSTWIYVIGGIGAVGLVGTMMAPKKTCKSDQDGCHAYYQQQRSPTDYSV
jgi:hypothetical protein